MVESRVAIRFRPEVAEKWKVIVITSDRSSGALFNEVIWVIQRLEIYLATCHEVFTLFYVSPAIYWHKSD